MPVSVDESEPAKVPGLSEPPGGMQRESAVLLGGSWTVQGRVKGWSHRLPKKIQSQGRWVQEEQLKTEALGKYPSDCDELSIIFWHPSFVFQYKITPSQFNSHDQHKYTLQGKMLRDA